MLRRPPRSTLFPSPTRFRAEAMEQLGQAILSSVVNTLVQAAVQALIVKPLLAAFGMTAESSLGASTAAAGESYAAWAPAAIAASIATLGSAAGTGLAAYAGATLAGAAIGKGRKNGGPVSAGGIYPVGESNLPEFLQTNSGLFMIPGNNGRVFSNKDITGDNGQPVIPKASTGAQYLSNSGNSNNSNTDKQSGNIQVNVQFVDQTSGGQHSFQAQAVQQEGVVTVTGLLTDAATGGPVSSAFQTVFGLSRKATGEY